VKALVCGECGDIQALQVEWRSCKCGNVEGHWTNPLLGTAEFKARRRDRAFILGLNNQLLGPALRGQLGIWEDFREGSQAGDESAQPHLRRVPSRLLGCRRRRRPDQRCALGRGRGMKVDLSTAEVERLLSLLNLTTAHDPRDSEGPCAGCTAREKLKKASEGDPAPR
jgi:hypothetical protein